MMSMKKKMKRCKVVEYVIEYTDKSLPEDRKSFLDAKCINALRCGGVMPDGVESIRVVNRA